MANPVAHSRTALRNDFNTDVLVPPFARGRAADTDRKTREAESRTYEIQSARIIEMVGKAHPSTMARIQTLIEAQLMT